MLHVAHFAEENTFLPYKDVLFVNFHKNASKYRKSLRALWLILMRKTCFDRKEMF